MPDRSRRNPPRIVGGGFLVSSMEIFRKNSLVVTTENGQLYRFTIPLIHSSTQLTPDDVAALADAVVLDQEQWVSGRRVFPRKKRGKP